MAQLESKSTSSMLLLLDPGFPTLGSLLHDLSGVDQVLHRAQHDARHSSGKVASMSYALTQAILRAYRGPRAAKGVLLVLADFADDGGVAWPSIATIAEAAQLKPRQVQNHLGVLADAGYIAPLSGRVGGRALSTRWLVVADPAAGTEGLEKGAADCTVSHENHATDCTLLDEKPRSELQGIPTERVQSLTKKGAANCTRRDQEEISTYAQPRAQVRKRRAAHDDPRFGRFWDVYPRKVGKVRAEKAWVRLAPDDLLADHIKARVEAQKLTREWKKDGGQFIPHPATYLNDRRFDDEPAPAAKQLPLEVAL